MIGTSFSASAQSAGFNSSYAVFSTSSGTVYYCMSSNTSCGSNPGLDGASLGNYVYGASNLILQGAQMNVYKCGGANISATDLNYRIYPSSGTPGSFIQLNVGYSMGTTNGCGGEDQQWEYLGENINVLSGLSVGTYTIEIYADESTTLGTQYLSNFGSNYKASFSVTAAPLTITASDQSKCSGTTLSLGTSAFTTAPSPLYGSDAVSSVTLTSAGAASSAAVGSYDIVPSAAAGSGLSNYSITYTDGTLTVGGNTWIGGNSNWNNAANWSCGVVPNSNTTDAIISSGNPILDISPTVNNLTLGTTLTLGSYMLTIDGSVTGIGTLTGSTSSNLTIGGAAGTLLFTSGSDSLNSLVLNSGSSATLGSSLAIASTGSVTVTGSGVLTTNGYLTIKSDNNGTGQVAAGSTNDYISGNVTVERYIPADADRAWRILSVPTQTTQSINAAWQEGQTGESNTAPGYGTIITTGTLSDLGNGFDAVTAFGSMQTYDPASGNWDYVTSTKIPIATTSGYSIYIRGDRTQTPSSMTTPTTPTTLRTMGPLYEGDQNALTVPSGEFGLIGNLYASAIDFNVLPLSNIARTFYVWDPKIVSGNSLGLYQTFSSMTNYATPTGGGSYGAAASTGHSQIESGLAFFVYDASPSLSGSIQLTESSKVSGSIDVFRPASPVNSSVLLQTNLYSLSGNTATQVDGNFSVYNSAYSDGINSNDAVKLANNGENIGILRDGKVLEIEASPPITSADTIFYDMWNMQQKGYELEFVPSNLALPGLTGYLKDNYLKTTTQLNLGNTTTASFAITSDTASAASNRFIVVFRPSSVVGVTFTNVAATAQGSSVTVSWNVAGETAISSYVVERSIDGINFTPIGTVSAKGNTGGPESYSLTNGSPVTGTGYYRVESIGTVGDINYTGTVTVVIGAPDITVYPNVVTDGGVVKIKFINQPSGRYTIRLLSVTGQLIYSAALVHSGGTEAQPLNLPVVAKGVYRLEALTPSKQTYVQKLIIGGN